MPIEVVHRYSRADLRENPNDLYVFGDNMARVGKGGQAAATRDEPNTVGIPTLWFPGVYFRAEDAFNPIVLGRIDAAFYEISAHLSNGGTVILPADGVGTGLARLAENCPRLMTYINDKLGKL